MRGAARGGDAVSPRGRDALVRAVIGRPEGLPPPAEVDLAPFWARFDATAPWHVRVGFAAAATVLGSVLPRLHGHRRGLTGLDPDAAERVVATAADHALTAPLCDAARAIACFAYLSDERVEAAVRARR